MNAPAIGPARSRLLDVIPDLALELDADGRCVDFAGGRRGGIDPTQLHGRLLSEVLPTDIAQAYEVAIAHGHASASPYSFTYRTSDGFFETRIVALAGGGVAVFVRDVTTLKRMEAVAHETELRFRTMADCAPVLLWMSGIDALCSFFNEPWMRFTGRTLEQELGTGWSEGVHPDDFDHCMNVYMSAFAARETFRMEYRLRRADGVYRWILDTGTPRFLTDGSFAGYVGSCVDITELKEAHAELELRVRERTVQLRTALDERETLLQEIHHRVKNNLQVISSLLDLQARELRGQDVVADAFEDIQRRLQSIALVHERLYQSKDLTRIHLREYVEQLAKNVERAFATAAVIVTRVASTELKVDQAIACGLIINELATNALKYAFPEGRRGTVDVSITSDGPEITLEVKDDGIGMPGEPCPAGTLGLSLVATLAEQLGGTLVRVWGEPGACFRVTFPAER